VTDAVVQLRPDGLDGVTGGHSAKPRTILRRALEYPLTPFRHVWRKDADAMIEIASLSGIDRPA
jgi:hypothetical protein